MRLAALPLLLVSALLFFVLLILFLLLVALLLLILLGKRFCDLFEQFEGFLLFGQRPGRLLFAQQRGSLIRQGLNLRGQFDGFLHRLLQRLDLFLGLFGVRRSRLGTSGRRCHC